MTKVSNNTQRKGEGKGGPGVEGRGGERREREREAGGFGCN
jgi:hypothetical protein